MIYPFDKNLPEKANKIEMPFIDNYSNEASHLPEGKVEFASMFYKAMLKQAFSDDFIGIGEGPYANFAKDILIEKMAKELALKDSSIINIINE